MVLKWIKKIIIAYLEEKRKIDRIKGFKKGAQPFIIIIVNKYDEIELYNGKSNNKNWPSWMIFIISINNFFNSFSYISNFKELWRSFLGKFLF